MTFENLRVNVDIDQSPRGQIMTFAIQVYEIRMSPVLWRGLEYVSKLKSFVVVSLSISFTFSFLNFCRN